MELERGIECRLLLPVAMAKLAIAALEHAGFEWVKAMGWDITPVSEVMGCTLGEPKIDLQKYIKEHPFADNLDGLAYPDNLFEQGRFPAYKEQFKILKDKLGDDVAVFGETEGAWTAEKKAPPPPVPNRNTSTVACSVARAIVT